MSVIKPAIQYPVLIAYLSGANNYTWLIFRNGEKKLLAKPISYLEEQLTGFVRIHKMTLVNPECVQQLHYPPRPKMTGSVELEGGVMLPVSRRRWNQVAEQLHPHLLTIDGPITGSASVSTDLSGQPGVMAVTDDAMSRLLLQQIFARKWPQYPLHILAQGDKLMALFEQLPQAELPALVLLDARTATLEQLRTLERLKEDQQLRRIPVLLLVSDMNRAVATGYQRRANSVISLPGGSHAAFTETIERIGQFWLQTASLPRLTPIGTHTGSHHA